MEYTIVPIDHAIKLAITAAIKRVEFKKYNVDPDEVVDALLTDIFADLFPHNPVLVSPTLQPITRLPVIQDENTTTTTTKPKKTRAKKSIEEVPTPAETEIVSSTPAEKEKKKPGPKPKNEPPQNIKKFNPSQMKKIEKANVNPKEFLDYLNSLSEEAYTQKKLDEHIQNFVTPQTAEEPLAEIPDCIDIEFDGKEYTINSKTRAVYVQEGEIYKKVGHVGMLEFADMEMPIVE